MTPAEIVEYRETWMPGIMCVMKSTIRDEAKEYLYENVEKHKWNWFKNITEEDDMYFFENILEMAKFRYEFIEYFNHDTKNENYGK